MEVEEHFGFQVQLVRDKVQAMSRFVKRNVLMLFSGNVRKVFWGESDSNRGYLNEQISFQIHFQVKAIQRLQSQVEQNEKLKTLKKPMKQKTKDFGNKLKSTEVMKYYKDNLGNKLKRTEVTNITR